jgi:hypothetical protein
MMDFHSNFCQVVSMLANMFFVTPILLIFITSSVTCEIYTSSYKIQRLRDKENEWLAVLKQYNITQYNKYKKELEL